MSIFANAINSNRSIENKYLAAAAVRSAKDQTFWRGATMTECCDDSENILLSLCTFVLLPFIIMGCCTALKFIFLFFRRYTCQKWWCPGAHAPEYALFYLNVCAASSLLCTGNLGVYLMIFDFQLTKKNHFCYAILFTYVHFSIY